MNLPDICNYNKNYSAGRRYQLRYSAGLYWLLDMEQSGEAYVSPLPLNEEGALIWSMLADGMTENAVCKRLCEKYEVSPEQAYIDVHEFIVQLKSKNVDFGGAL